MHWLIPFAAACAETAQAALATLALPNLQQRLRTLTATEGLQGDEYGFTPPHERALAHLYGWHGDDGLWPFGAQAAAADGVTVDDAPWALLTPTHWAVGADQVTLVDPQALQLADDESRALFAAVRPLFESEGWRLEWGHALRWYAGHVSLAALRTASLDRVIGRNVDLWLSTQREGRLVRRLQSEVQMLLYHHPANDAREARGHLPVNSFWLSGCGAAQALAGTAASTPVTVVDTLRASAVSGDWAAWCDAWRALDARLGDDNLRMLTLCGERHAQRFELRPRGLATRLVRAWRAPPVHGVLESL
jgi:hypothetical protein